MHTTKHEFALFWQGKKSLKEQSAHDTCLIDDPILYHRIITVLRLKKDEEITLFDRFVHCRVKIIALERKHIVTTVLHSAQNTIIQPSLTFLLPLLKREALHEAIYSLTEIGCTTIQLITTKKIHGFLSGEKEFEKMQKIVIAAAEQSKNFNFPEILKPISLENALAKGDLQTNAKKIFFDPNGISCNQFLTTLERDALNTTHYFLLIGPEGDLTQQEKGIVHAAHFSSIKLTQTILRAQQAALLGAGIIRSYMRE